MTELFIDFGKLAERTPMLAAMLDRATGTKRRSGVHTIDLDELDFVTRTALTTYIQKFPDATVSPVTTTAPVVTAAPPPEPSAAEPGEEQIDLGAYEKEMLQKAIDEGKGTARLKQYVDEQRLADTKENADAIRDWFDQNLKGYISAPGMDAAIANLGPRGTNVLTWKSKATIPPPVPESTAEVLGVCSDGLPQLPLNTPQSVLKKASAAQVKDWLARTRKATNQQYIRKGHGTTF